MQAAQRSCRLCDCQSAGQRAAVAQQQPLGTRRTQQRQALKNRRHDAGRAPRAVPSYAAHRHIAEQRALVQAARRQRLLHQRHAEQKCLILIVNGIRRQRRAAAVLHSRTQLRRGQYARGKEQRVYNLASRTD